MPQTPDDNPVSKIPLDLDKCRTCSPQGGLEVMESAAHLLCKVSDPCFTSIRKNGLPDVRIRWHEKQRRLLSLGPACAQ